MDLHDGNLDGYGDVDGHDPAVEDLSGQTDLLGHSMIATGYEGPGTEDPLSSGLDPDDAGNPGADGSGGDPGAEGITPAAGGHQIDITINDQQFEGSATLDSDGDGHDDTALVTLNEQGNQAALVDLNDDGHADQATLFDPDGQVIDHQHVDSSGTWVDDGGPEVPTTPDGSSGPSALGTATVAHDPAGATGQETALGQDSAEHSGDPIRMNLHGHTYETTDTTDTDDDGTADRGVLPTSDGGELVVTDTDGDGTADHAQVYDASGHDRGGMFVTSDGETTPDAEAQTAAVTDRPGTHTWIVDPATGDWVAG